jgi:excisionase family DNA binding protein
MNHTSKPLTTGEVADIFGVTTTTVKRWADDGRLASFKTPGGHYRFRAEDVESLKASTTITAGSAA